MIQTSPGIRSRGDSLDAYIARLGDVPLLAQRAERELARRIEEAELAVARALLHSPFAVQALAQIERELRAGTVRARELTRRPTALGDTREERAWARSLRDLQRALEASHPVRPRRMLGGRRAARGLESLRPGRALLDRMIRTLRALLPESSERSVRRLSDDELAALRATLEAARRRERTADRARGLLVRANLRLVVSIARRHHYAGTPLIDLIQEGNIGLMKAVDKFDYKRGYRFSTYATWWIRQAVSRSVANTAQTIRVPVHMLDAGRRVARARMRIEQSRAGDATVEELSEVSGFSLEKIERALHAWREPLSLEMPLGSEGDVCLRDRLRDTEAEDPLESVIAAGLAREARSLLAILTPREREVLELRFGLDGGDGRTLEAIGRMLSLTRERIRQIEAEALEKLREPLGARRIGQALEQ